MAGGLQTALRGTPEGNICLSHDSPLPNVSTNLVLIKVKAVSINPVDSKMTDAYVTTGAVAGCDFAGVVEQIGPDVTNVKVGDRVSTSVMGMNPLNPTVGAFAEYTTASENLLLNLPHDMSFEEGASLPTSFLTAGLALFHNMDLPGRPFSPSEKNITVLVYGGSSATGTAAIQLLKLAGFNILTTCSPHNFDLVRECGAKTVFDYQDPNCISDIKKHTKNGLRYVLDCISTLASMQFCYKVMGRPGGMYTALEPYPESIAQTRSVIRPDWILTLQVLGHDIVWPEPHHRSASEDIAEFGATWTTILNRLLKDGLIKPHPLIVRGGGLTKVLEGVEDIRSKKVSGEKIVYLL